MTMITAVSGRGFALITGDRILIKHEENGSRNVCATDSTKGQRLSDFVLCADAGIVGINDEIFRRLGDRINANSDLAECSKELNEVMLEIVCDEDFEYYDSIQTKPFRSYILLAGFNSDGSTDVIQHNIDFGEVRIDNQTLAENYAVDCGWCAYDDPTEYRLQSLYQELFHIPREEIESLTLEKAQTRSSVFHYIGARITPNSATLDFDVLSLKRADNGELVFEKSYDDGMLGEELGQ
ncbi:hypothetical protein [Paenibacillus alvei]|uniref:Uncharacterized protein n=1 Tax=Paenibacillus alvei TaxID=44250 RepID=A0AAP7DJB5_PAEAL|nr:hypothetical protein [Paenibacillus alvei]NOJ71409.1 hypothetical protein [Paenibacillus alvei]